MRKRAFCGKCVRIVNKLVGQVESQQPNRDINKEDPAPVVAVRDPTTQYRADGVCGDDDYGKQCECGGALGRGKRIDQDCLGNWSESPSANPLQDTKKQHESERWRQSTQQRRHGEEQDAEQVIVLAPHQPAEPGGHRQHDSVGHQIGGKNPCDFIVAVPQSAADVG